MHPLGSTGTTHGPEALSTRALMSCRLLPPGSVARKNRCDSKTSARPAPPSRKPRTGLAYGNPSGIPPRGRDSTGPGTEAQEAGNAQHCLQGPQSRCQGPEYGRDLLQRPRPHHKHEMGTGPGAPVLPLHKPPNTNWRGNGDEGRSPRCCL